MTSKEMIYAEHFSNIMTKANSLLSKKVTFALRGKKNVHKDSVQILLIHSYGTVQFLQSVPISAS
jgi:hypothetical protein